MTVPPPGPTVEGEPVLLQERRGGVLLVTMNRPAQRNALNQPLRSALRDAFDSFDEDDSVQVAVLTGNGPSFCAGGDLKEMAATSMKVPGRDSEILLGSSGRPKKPVIAAVNGHALAGGFLLAQDCDLCIAADTAVFGITEVKRGRGSPWAAPLISMVSKRIMMEILITGQPMTAQRAYEVGFVNHIVPAECLLDRALDMAATIAANAPLSVSAAMRTVELATEVGRSEALARAQELYEGVYLSEDAQEGPRAFAEKRAPRWSGK